MDVVASSTRWPSARCGKQDSEERGVRSEEQNLSMRKHHGLKAWQEGIELAQAIYMLSAAFPSDERFGMTSQMRRAAVSVPSNITEGAARNTKKEFAHFLTIARGSLSELDTQLILAEKLGLTTDSSKVRELLDLEFKLIGGLINSMKEAD